MKRQLDVAGELAVVVDVARSAVCAARQLVECTDHQLGAATARTQQVPAQLEQPLRDRLQAHLDDVALVLAPLTGQRHRPDAHEIDLLRGRDPAAQPATEAVAVGGPVDARRHRVEPGVGRSREPRRRLEGCLAAPCRPVTGGVGEAGEDAPCDPKENGSQGEGAEQVGSRGLDLVVAEGAAAAVGLEAQRRAQAVDWAPENTRRWRNHWPSTHSIGISSQAMRIGPRRASAKKRTEPSACVTSSIACLGMPAASLNLAVSASAGHSASGGWSKRHSNVRR